MARIDWVEQRLENWARWLATRGSGALGFASVNLSEANAGRDGYVTSAVPISDVEASVTDDAVRRLPGELRAVVESAYLSSDFERVRLARLCISKSTYHERIGRAHRLLAEHFQAREDRQRAERERVEQLASAVRPRLKRSFTS